MTGNSSRLVTHCRGAACCALPGCKTYEPFLGQHTRLGTRVDVRGVFGVRELAPAFGRRSLLRRGSVLEDVAASQSGGKPSHSTRRFGTQKISGLAACSRTPSACHSEERSDEESLLLLVSGEAGVLTAPATAVSESFFNKLLVATASGGFSEQILSCSKWWSRWGSNPRPSRYHRDALANRWIISRSFHDLIWRSLRTASARESNSSW